jgi:DNA-binding response OmpR family regulator
MKNSDMKRVPIVVLAEDDKAIVEVLTIILQDEGLTVKAVQHYKDLKKVIKEETISLVLLDLWLSGENGSDMCLAIKNDEHTKDIPVIILSANQDIESIAQSVSADEFIQKPFDIDVLLEKVKRFINR